MTIKLDNVNFNYHKKTIFKNLSVSLPTGSFTLLTGNNGSGKSTLLKLISHLLPSAGTITRPDNWTMIFQDPTSHFVMSTPLEELVFTLENLNLAPTLAQKKIKQVATEFKITDLLNQPLQTLSSGEKQRISFAIAAAMEPDLLLLDEAFSNCDHSTRQLLLKQLAAFKKKGTTIIAVDHQVQGYEDLITHHLTIKNYGVQLSNFIPPSTKFSKKILPIPAAKNKIFELNNFSLSLPQKILLNCVTNFIPQGITLLTGDNGSGKSTFFKSLIQMFPYQGHLLYQEKEVRKLRQKKYLTKVGEVFTDSTPQFLKITPAQEIALAKQKTKFFSQTQIDQMVAQLQLPDLNQSIYTLSGGQKKKLQIFLMLLENQQVLLLDEPLTGLDEQGQRIISKWLKRSSQFKNIIIISHQIGPLSEIIDYHLHLTDQTLVFESSLNIES